MQDGAWEQPETRCRPLCRASAGRKCNQAASLDRAAIKRIAVLGIVHDRRPPTQVKCLSVRGTSGS